MANNSSSDFLENRIINTYLRTELSTASPVYIAIYKSEPNETGEANQEVADGLGYIRMTGSGADIPPGGGGINELGGGFITTPAPISNWTVRSASATNKHTITFPVATGQWGPPALYLNYVVLASGSHFSTTGSRVYFYGPLREAAGIGLDINSNDILSFPINSLHVFLQGAYSTYLGNSILDQYLNNLNVYQPTTNVELRLFITLPDRDGNGGMEVPTYIAPEYSGSINMPPEWSPTGYQRKNVAGTDVWWQPLNGSASTIGDINWGTVTGDWGYVEGVGIYETINNNLLFRTYLNNPRQVLSGDTFKISSGSMKVVLD